MRWRIEVKPTAEKQFLKLDRITRKRIKEALLDLEQSTSPLLHQRVRALTGKLKGDYRVRVGSWRLLFTPDKEAGVLHVYAILPRGGSY